MAALLAEISQGADATLPYLANAQRVAALRGLPALADAAERAGRGLMIAQELLRAGESEAAIQELLELKTQAELEGAGRSKGDVRILELLGIAYLRQSIQLNCIGSGVAEACILPIRGASIHTSYFAIGKAVDLFSELLALDSTNLRWLWLLNSVGLSVAF